MIGAALYVLGSLLVLGGAFMPIAARVYGRRAPAQQIAAVAAAPAAWRWHHILLGAGAAVTAAGAYWEAVGSGSAALIGAAVGFALGAAIFLHFLQARLFMPPTAWFGSELGKRRFAAFVTLMSLAIVMRGIAALQAGHVAGWLLCVYGVALLAAVALGRALQPFAPYVATLALGIGLLP